MKIPAVLVEDQLMDPVGEDPVTVAVQVVDEPAVTDAGLQLTPTVEVTRVTPIWNVP